MGAPLGTAFEILCALEHFAIVFFEALKSL